MSTLKSINIYYNNPNKPIQKDGYIDYCHLINIEVKDINNFQLGKITTRLRYNNNEINENYEVGEFYFRFNTIYDELLDKDIVIYRIELIYDDNITEYDITQSLYDEESYGGSLIIDKGETFLDIKYDDNYHINK